MASKSSRTVSRRSVLKTAAAAAVGGGATALMAGDVIAAQGAPGIRTGAQAGRRFRAFVKWNTDAASLQELTLRPISRRQIVVRTEAAQCCYTLVDQALLGNRPIQRATILGHGGVGFVEAVGPQVVRIQVGDRVLVNQRAQCGSCYNCMRMRADKCLISGGLGASIALDPNAEGDKLVLRIQDLCKPKTDRLFASGGNVGPDHVIEAVGGDRLPPKTERGPDPTGVLPLQQGWELCSQIGTLVTTSVGHPADAKVQIPASQWTDGPKHHLPGTMGGCNPRRDSPRFIRLMERGQLDLKSIATASFPIDRVKEAFQAAADRTTISASVVFHAT